MKKLTLCITFICLALGRPAQADTLELANGTLLEGDFVGSNNGIIMFNAGDDIEAFPKHEVVALFFSAGVATAEEAVQSASMPDSIVLPAGTRLVIRITDNLDSNRHSPGHRFRGQLESALVVDGVTAAPRGTFVHGRIVQASRSGRLAGSSELTLEFTDLMIDDVLISIRTGGLSAQTGGEAARTVGRTARAAAIGGLARGSSGARKGARIGAGASILTRGASINIPRGTIVETSLAEKVSINI